MRATPFSTRSSPNKIWFLQNERGTSEVVDMLSSLDTRTLASANTLFERTETEGPPRSEEKFRRLRGSISEFKVHRAKAVRFLAFRMDRGWIVATATPKRKSNATQAEIRRAEGLMRRFEEEGEPYE
jgi:hypothetical protein